MSETKLKNVEVKFTNLDLKVALDEMRTEFRYLRSTVESLAKTIEGTSDRDNMIEKLNLDVRDLSARLEATVPILEVLLHDKVRPGFKRRLIGEGFREVPTRHAPFQNPDMTERW